jgi:hypothetical protein
VLTFTNTGGTGAYEVGSGDIAAREFTYDAVNNRLSATSVTLTALIAGSTVKANIFMLTDDTAANIDDGVTAAFAASAFDIAAGGAEGFEGATADLLKIASVTSTATAAPVTAISQVTAVASATVANSGAATVDAISDAGTVSAKVTVTPATGQSKSGIAVTWTVAEQGNNTLDAAATVTAGGKELKNTNGGSLQSITTIVTYTDGDGVALLPITYKGTVDANAITVDADVNEIDGADSTITFKDNVASTTKNITAIGPSAEYRVAVGAAFTLKSGVVDLFGQALKGSNYTVTATDDSATPRVITAALVDGVATLSMPSYATAQTRTITLQAKYNGITEGTSSTVTVVVGAQGTPAKITLSGAITGTGAGSFGVTTAIPINTKTFSEVDTRVSGVAPSLDAQYIDVTALVLDAANAPISADVTFSGTGLDFVVDGVYKKNEVTVRGTAAGQQTVRVYSSVAGTKTLTVKSGTVTTTEKIYFGQPAASAATTVTITAVDSIAPGNTFVVSGLVADKFGNGVNATDFVVSYTGPGFYGTLPTTLTNGKFTFNVLVSAADAGAITITASVYTGSDQKSASKTVTVAKSPVTANIGSFNGRVAVRMENAKGSSISVKIGKQWYKYESLSANYLKSWKSRKGSTQVVSVYVDGDLENTATITVK